MWFLQIDILVRLVIACTALSVLSAVTRHFLKRELATKLLLLFDMGFLIYVSKELAIFYAAYTVITYIMVRTLNPLKKLRSISFVLFCIACAVPFFYVRVAEFFPQLPVMLVLVGIAYNMLKAIDALYYVYYSEKSISFYVYANYILFFPTLTSGPIFRYRDFEKTFMNPLKITSELVEACVKRFIRGMFKKMVALSFATILFDRLLAMESRWYISLAVVAMSYLVLYLDLSGYSDIAIALGRVAGINVPENFKKPLEAMSMTQFWRNWHVTLSDWIREHIYVLVAGKKLNRFHSALIAFVTMMIFELWHGFTFPLVLGGVYNGGILAIENLFSLTTVDRRKASRPYMWFRCALTNFLFGINTLLFTMDSSQMRSVLYGFLKI